MVIKSLSDDSGKTADYEILETAELVPDSSPNKVRIIVRTNPPNSGGFPANPGNLSSLSLQAEAAALERDIRRQELEAENPSSPSSMRANP